MALDPQSRRRIARQVGGIAVGTVLLVVAVLWAFYLLDRCGRPLSGLTETSTDECVGVVTDARFVDGGLADLVRMFERSNADVAASGDRYVKVVLLTPMSVPADGSPAAAPLPQVRESLEGAYTALSRANSTADFGSPTAARIQVVLANQGSRQEYSPSLVDAVIRQDDEEHPVVAVVGLGSSFEGTLETARAFAQRQIPMVSAIASADGLNISAMPGLRSVSPSNTEYARALRTLLDGQVVLNSGMIVADRNDDPYVSSLRSAFAGELGRYVRYYPDQAFNGSTIVSGATPGVFNPVVASICTAAFAPDPVERLDMVFYAGRVADFRTFVETLNGRTCRSAPLTILVGATGFDAAREYEKLIEDANLTVVYATSADAPTWTTARAGTPLGFGRFLGEFRARGFDDRGLADGYAIMYHDAVASAAVAIRLAAQSDRIPKARDVDTQFNNVALAYPVYGASGTLSFAASPDGRAAGKLIPLRQIGLTTPIRLPDDRCTYIVGAPCAGP